MSHREKAFIAGCPKPAVCKRVNRIERRVNQSAAAQVDAATERAQTRLWVIRGALDRIYDRLTQMQADDELPVLARSIREL